jgi:hypothetical protein
MPKFENVSCSQCGRDFGPGDHGFSHCRDHMRQGPTEYVDVVFDGPPAPEAGRFVEVENDQGVSIKFGEWVHRPDGYWALRIWEKRHTHAAGTMVGKDIDECARCGHDIRHAIHAGQ